MKASTSLSKRQMLLLEIAWILAINVKVVLSNTCLESLTTTAPKQFGVNESYLDIASGDIDESGNILFCGDIEDESYAIAGMSDSNGDYQWIV